MDSERDGWRESKKQRKKHMCVCMFLVYCYIYVYICVNISMSTYFFRNVCKKRWLGRGVPRGVPWGFRGGSRGFRGVPCYFCHSQTPCLRGVPLQRLSLFKILKWEYGHPRPGQPRPEPLPLSRNLEAMWARCDATW